MFALNLNTKFLSIQCDHNSVNERPVGPARAEFAVEGCFIVSKLYYHQCVSKGHK